MMSNSWRRRQEWTSSRLVLFCALTQLSFIEPIITLPENDCCSKGWETPAAEAWNLLTQKTRAPTVLRTCTRQIHAWQTGNSSSPNSVWTGH